MEWDYAEHRYSTKLVADNRDGFAGLELHRTLRRDPADAPKRVAQVVFWDAAGQFFIETFGTDIPVAVAERLIAEVRSALAVR